MALWGGRFTQGPDQRFKDFNDSLKFDYRMAIEDIDGSVGWAKALCEVGVLTEKECADLQFLYRCQYFLASTPVLTGKY